ncbi:MAG: hypothetical protein NZ608_02100, partial [candidate division WOR-3 bacterium]|nr:hypothetical protein [candidate division WOR-3 bacterium]
MSVIINVFLYFQLFYGTLLQEMWQIKETNKDISKFFKNLNLPYKSDTIFVFIFKPGVAPRIEAGINPFIKYLRKQRIKNDIIIFAISNKKKAAEKYLKRSGFDADYQYVVNEKFLKFFEFSTGVFLGPFACKFSISKGELISSFPLTAKIDSQTVSEFIKDFSCPKVKKAHLTPPIKKIGKESKINIIKKIRLYENEEYPLSSPLFISVSPLRNYLAITDQMTQLIYIFDLSSGKFINLLYPDSLEEKMFINLSEKEYSSLKKFFKSMYFNHCFYNDSILLITASLPAVKKEIKNSDTIIAYLNEPCLVLKEIFFNKIKKLNSFSLPTPNFNHISASFVVETKMIFLPFRKGWPYGITMLNEKIPVEDNPFRKEFYEKDLHL